MKKHIIPPTIFCFILLMTNTVFAQSNDAVLKGTIKSDKGKFLAMATIQVNNTPYGTISDTDGNFYLKIPSGNYELEVKLLSYHAIKLSVKLEKGLNVRDFVLTNKNEELEEVVLNGKMNKNISKKTDYVARMPLRNIENPQVYTVINKDLIKEQIAVNVDDVLRNSTGTIPLIYPSGGLGVTFRGFSTGINARNGMETVTGRSTVDVANIERIEILKGPSATLFGASVSSFGGVVNLVTKKPLDTKSTKISYTGGSYGLNRLTTDINIPLTKNKKILFRLNTAINKQKSFLSYGYNNTYLIAPSLFYKVSEKLSFTLDTELYSANNTRIRYDRYDVNSNVNSSRDIKLDYKTAMFHDDANAETTSTKVFINANYHISDNWKSSTILSFVGEDVDHSYQYYATWLSPTVATRTMGVWGPIYNNYTNIQENINGQFNTGNIKHKIVAGVNYRHHRVNANAKNTGGIAIDTINTTTDFKPLRKEDVDPFLNPGYWPGWNQSENHTLSAYATDVITINSRLSTMLSLRLDYFNRTNLGGAESYKQTALAPKLGLVYQIVKEHISLFGNYMSGFQNTAPINQPDGSQFIVDPIFANQYEGGLKAEVLKNKLSTTISYYNITIDNATRTKSDGFVVQDGKQISKGLDFEIIANPIKGLNIIAGYAYNNNSIVKSTDPTIEGNKAIGAPENVINFWTSYRFSKVLRGFGLGFGANYVDKVYKFSDNVFFSPSYTIANATGFYEQDNWRLGLKVNNLSNQKYWDTNGVAQTPINFAINLNLKF